MREGLLVGAGVWAGVVMLGGRPKGREGVQRRFEVDERGEGLRWCSFGSEGMDGVPIMI